MRRQGIKNRIGKLSRQLPPSWAELERLFLQAAKRPSQAELDALVATHKGRATDAQKAIAQAYLTKNMSRAFVVFGAIYPRWAECPDLKNETQEQD